MSKNMYKDAYTWNVFVGCEFHCGYCLPSFQRQMKRQKPGIDKNGKKRGCQLCYDYIPHFHPERLNNKLPKTKGDEFIWCGSSGDISFIEYPNMLKILKKIEVYPNRTFFFQTKNPDFFHKFIFPSNVILGITLESDIYYKEISKAPFPYERVYSFLKLVFPRKFITIEPILIFQKIRFLGWIRDIHPERIYIGYDTKKYKLPEPSLQETIDLINGIKQLGIKVKTKLLREKWK